MTILRLNYATECATACSLDIALTRAFRKAGAASMGYLNAIWQADAVGYEHRVTCARHFAAECDSISPDRNY